MIKDPELLKLAVKAIEAEPERWDQDNWAVGVPKIGKPIVTRGAGRVMEMEFMDTDACGTTMCLAGHVVHQAGLPLLLSAGWGGVRLATGICLDEEGNRANIAAKAQELLGIDVNQADQLFGFFTNDLGALKQRITQVTGVEFE